MVISPPPHPNSYHCDPKKPFRESEFVAAVSCVATDGVAPPQPIAVSVLYVQLSGVTLAFAGEGATLRRKAPRTRLRRQTHGEVLVAPERFPMKRIVGRFLSYAVAHETIL